MSLHKSILQLKLAIDHYRADSREAKVVICISRTKYSLDSWVLTHLSIIWHVIKFTDNSQYICFV